MAISEEVADVHQDAERVMRISDALSHTVEQLGHEADTLDNEVFRFKLPAARPGGQLAVGLHHGLRLEDTRGLDPVSSGDVQVTEVLSAMYSTLLRFEDGVLVPDLAESWTADRSGCRYRFTLRRGVTFADGVELNAHHVKAHFERLLDPNVAAPEAGLFKDITGASEYVAGRAKGVSGIEVLADDSIELRLEEPRAFFLRMLALPATSVTRLEGGRLFGTGPFRLVGTTSDSITMERNPAYHRPGLPLLAGLKFQLFGVAPRVARGLPEGSGAVRLVPPRREPEGGRGRLDDGAERQHAVGVVPRLQHLDRAVRRRAGSPGHSRRSRRARGGRSLSPRGQGGALAHASVVARERSRARAAQGHGAGPAAFDRGGALTPAHRPAVRARSRLARRRSGALRLAGRGGAGRIGARRDPRLLGPGAGGPAGRL